MSRLLRIVAAPAAFIFLLLPLVAQATFVTSLTDTHVQTVLQRYFPLREYAAFARVSLHEPQVQLIHDSQDVMLMIPVEANISGGELRRGHATMAVGLNYQPANGGVYLYRPRLKDLQIPGVSASQLAELKVIVETIGQNSLPLVRIYQVNERELNHSLAKSALKSYEIDDGRLKLVFGFK
jgi:hypothetical protein